MNIKPATDMLYKLRDGWTQKQYDSLKGILLSLQEPEDDKTMDMFVAIWKRLDRIERSLEGYLVPEPSSVSEMKYNPDYVMCEACQGEGFFDKKPIEPSSVSELPMVGLRVPDVSECEELHKAKTEKKCEHGNTTFTLTLEKDILFMLMMKE
jgi:hypothetical protein